MAKLSSSWNGMCTNSHEGSKDPPTPFAPRSPPSPVVFAGLPFLPLFLLLPAFFGALSAFFCPSSAAAVFSAASSPAVDCRWAALRRRRTAIGDGRVGHRARTRAQAGCRRPVVVIALSQMKSPMESAKLRTRCGIETARARVSLNFSQVTGYTSMINHNTYR